MRSISTNALTAMTAEESGEVFLILMTLSNASIAEPIRVVNDLVNHDSRGNTFQAYPFTVSFPLDDGFTFPSINIKIDNVDRALVDSIRTAEGAIEVLIEVVLYSDLNNVEIELPNMSIRTIDYDESTITAAAAIDDMLNQKFPNRNYTPNYFPGIF